MHQFLSFGPLSSMHQFLYYDPTTYWTYPNITSDTHIMTLYVTKGPLRSERPLLLQKTPSHPSLRNVSKWCTLQNRGCFKIYDPPNRLWDVLVKDILSLHNMLHVQTQAEVEIFLRLLFLCAVKLNILVKLQTYKSFNIPGFDMPSSTTVQ